MLFLVQPSPRQGSMSPPHSSLVSLPSLQQLVPTQSHLTLMGFDGVEAETFFIVILESFEEDKGREFPFKIFKSPFVDLEDAEVNPLHVIFNLKEVFVGKDYFRIHHLLPLPFNLTQDQTLLGKNIVPKLALKEFLLRCLEQFTIYI